MLLYKDQRSPPRKRFSRWQIEVCQTEINRQITIRKTYLWKKKGTRKYKAYRLCGNVEKDKRQRQKAWMYHRRDAIIKVFQGSLLFFKQKYMVKTMNSYIKNSRKITRLKKFHVEALNLTFLNLHYKRSRRFSRHKKQYCNTILFKYLF